MGLLASPSIGDDLMARFVILSLVLLVPTAALAADQDAKQLAQAILTKGAALFDTRDAAAMAATYAENAEITTYSKDNQTGALKTETGRGRANIQKAYADLFKNRSSSTRCRNVVEDAHFVGPDLLVIRGMFILDVADEHPIPFIQVRTKQGDKWLILNLQLFGVSEKWTR
jgi:ketosteroid isomerase-like protein